MVIGFIVWTLVAAIFVIIGTSCRKAKDAVGFFTFVKPPAVKDTEKYNKSVSILWLVVAVVLEIIGIPMLFLQQNSPWLIPMPIAGLFGIIVMMVVYLRIEAKYRD